MARIQSKTAKRRCAFRSVGTLAIALNVFSAIPASAQPQVLRYTLSIDERPAVSAQGYWNGAHVLLSLPDTARALHLPLRRADNSYILTVGEDHFRISPREVDITEGGALVASAVVVPEIRNGTCFVSLDDLQTLTADAFTADGMHIDVATAEAARTIAKAAVRKSASTYNPNAENASAGKVGDTAGSRTPSSVDSVLVQIAVLQQGDYRSRGINIETNGTNIRGGLDLSSYGGWALTPSGSLSIGPNGHFISVGSAANPLYGMIFNTASMLALEDHLPSDVIGYAHDMFGRSITSFKEIQPDKSYTVGIVRDNGSTLPLLGTSADTSVGNYSWFREAWTTTRGIGLGTQVSTQGRLYAQLAAADVMGQFPLDPGEAQQRANLAYRIAQRLQIQAGYQHAYLSGGAAFVNLSGYTAHGIGGSISLAGESKSASLSANGSRGYFSASYSTSVGVSSLAMSGSQTFGSRQLEVFSVHTSGDNDGDDSVRWKPSQGSGIVLGVERVRSTISRLGPIIGFVLPVSPTLSLELTEHPTAEGHALRVSASQRITLPQRAQSHQVAIIFDEPPARRYRVEIDDRNATSSDAGSIRLAVPQGGHRINIVSEDGLFGSPAIPVGDSDREVHASLWPIVPVSGRVVLDSTEGDDRARSLANIEVVIEPGHTVALTNDDGTFAFGALPVAPHARIAIAKESIPANLSIGDDAPITLSPLELHLQSHVHIHRTIFH
jgi:hypothetical protein